MAYGHCTLIKLTGTNAYYVATRVMFMLRSALCVQNIPQPLPQAVSACTRSQEETLPCFFCVGSVASGTFRSSDRPLLSYRLGSLFDIYTEKEPKQDCMGQTRSPRCTGHALSCCAGYLTLAEVPHAAKPEERVSGRMLLAK